ncbi:MAG: hypothetical protein LBC80_04005 [Treponema sp.]|jgi:HPt (histidine-containing phosphotransfer) domain-containing protein|nr:hypothetical protein [Treponema sp.]
MSNTKINIPGLNADSGLSFCDGELSIYLQSLNLFTSNMSKKLDIMRNVTQEKMQDYMICAHGAKSISEYIGAEETHKTAKQLEMMAKEGNLSGILAINDTFINNTEKLIDNIKNWLKDNKAT